MTSGGVVSEIGEEAIRDVLEQMKGGMEEEGLDPMEVDDYDVTHKLLTLSARVTISSMVLRGMSRYKVEDVRLNLQNMALSVTLSGEILSLEGHYKIKGRMMKIIPLSFKGSFHVATNHPKVCVKARLRERNGSLNVKSLNSDIQSHGVKLQLNNLAGASMTNRLLENVVSQYLYKQKDQLAEIFSTSLKTHLNNGLRNVNFGLPIQLLQTGDKLIRRGSLHL